jgi:hypothetical protein
VLLPLFGTDAAKVQTWLTASFRKLLREFARLLGAADSGQGLTGREGSGGWFEPDLVAVSEQPNGGSTGTKFESVFRVFEHQFGPTKAS